MHSNTHCLCVSHGLLSSYSMQQVIIGFDTTEMIEEMELPISGPSEIGFGIEEIEGEDSDVEDDEEDEGEEDDSYDDEWDNVLEDEDEDETLGDWAKLDTMRSSHPMYFAKKLSEAASDDPVDWMEEPPAGLAIQGFLRPALIEEHSDIQKHISGNQSHDADIDQVGMIVENEPENLHIVNGHRHGSESSKGQFDLRRRVKEETCYIDIWKYNIFVWIMVFTLSSASRMECRYSSQKHVIMDILIHLFSEAIVEVEDVRTAQPDAIVHSAAKIISHLKAGGEKTKQALKSLCWRSKGIQVEEAALIAVDSLGFDLRVCSGTQIQTLRFAFKTRGGLALSSYQLVFWIISKCPSPSKSKDLDKLDDSGQA
ncbi:hypothetical protein Pint_17551 [Pistacia integerrima]|uniref:Uncharacterized protein n=1 Tax=Pistacia integerrima TaxID=434235 RepID=A0ACC0YYT2_9ROSI|nr:hypothetical protein Pint_17551 [Pistacia integerrima]